MAIVKVSWVLPTTVVPSGRPLAVSDIDFVELSLAAEGGESVVIDTFKPDVLETMVTDLELGVWVFTGVVVGVNGRRGIAVSAAIELADDSVPGSLQLVLTEV